MNETRRLVVTLPQTAFLALVERAAQEHRPPRDQLELLIDRALKPRRRRTERAGAAPSRETEVAAR
jgi:hypothetical protein